ncbi:hypothetical protein JRQ81_016551, partial [Phrynocephalus forsythii]
ICKDDYKVTLFHAASIIAALRVSELVASSKADQLNRALRFDDLAIEQGKIALTLCKSKTDQCGRGQLIQLGRCAIEHICPVSAMLNYVTVEGQNPNPFFQQSNDSPSAVHAREMIFSHSWWQNKQHALHGAEIMAWELGPRLSGGDEGECSGIALLQQLHNIPWTILQVY